MPIGEANKTVAPRDCRKIANDVSVIISRDTAMEALRLMEKAATEGVYANMYADDASFIRANLAELREAAR